MVKTSKYPLSFYLLLVWKLLSSGMWHRAVWYKAVDVSEDTAAFIISVAVTLLMEAAETSET